MKKAMERVTPVSSPASTPNKSTAPSVTIWVTLSSRWIRQCVRKLWKSSRLVTDTMTMAASAAWGR